MGGLLDGDYYFWWLGRVASWFSWLGYGVSDAVCLQLMVDVEFVTLCICGCCVYCVGLVCLAVICWFG